MLRAILCAAALMLSPMAQAADLDRTRSLLEDDFTRDWINAMIDTIATPWALLPIEDETALEGAVARHFDRDAIFEELAARTAAALSDAQLQAILDWRATQAGARFIAAAEAAPECDDPGAACGEALARMEIFADPRLGPIRLAAARQNLAAIDLEIQINILRAALEAGLAPPDEDPMAPEDVAAFVQDFAQGAQGAFERWHEEALADVLASFTADEILAFANFVASDAVQIYLLATGGALNDALSRRAGRLGRDFAIKGASVDL